jgi:endonuclease G
MEFLTVTGRGRRYLAGLTLMVPLVVLSGAYAAPLEDCQEYTHYGVPGTQGDLLCRKGYLLAHDPERKTPIWVIEHLTMERLDGPHKRTDRFKADPDLEPGQRAELTDYKKSGYARGHMAPADNMKWDKQAMAESFYLSNMVPQVGSMNSGIWRILEAKVQKWAKDRGGVFVFTGPIYLKDTDTRFIGTNKVAVPDQLYKIVFDPQAHEAIAFAMPNGKLETDDMATFIVSIDLIETLTDLDFLSELDEAEQMEIESQGVGKMWQ